MTKHRQHKLPDNWKSGFIGFTDYGDHAKLLQALLRACGILSAKVKRGVGTSWRAPSYMLYCDPADVPKAREIKRGFQAALAIRGKVEHFMIGVRAAQLLRVGDPKLHRRYKVLAFPQPLGIDSGPSVDSKPTEGDSA